MFAYLPVSAKVHVICVWGFSCFVR